MSLLPRKVCDRFKVYALGISNNVNFTEIQCIGENDDTIFNFESFAELANVISDAIDEDYKEKEVRLETIELFRKMATP